MEGRQLLRLLLPHAALLLRGRVGDTVQELELVLIQRPVLALRAAEARAGTPGLVHFIWLGVRQETRCVHSYCAPRSRGRSQAAGAWLD